MRAKTDNAKTATKLLVAMTGKASSAKGAEGDEPVFAYIASSPQPQRGFAERIDALAAKTYRTSSVFSWTGCGLPGRSSRARGLPLPRPQPG